MIKFTRHGISVYAKHGLWHTNQLTALCWGKSGISLYYWSAPHRLWSAHLCPRLLFGRNHTAGRYFGFVRTYSFGPLSFALCDVWSKRYAEKP